MKGKLYGVGLGPGDPELMTVRATRLLRNAGIIAYFAKAGRVGNARRIADGLIAANAVEVPLYYPVTTEIPADDPAYGAQIAAFYDQAALSIAGYLDAGRDVALLCEGDPFFYGSFMHIWRRLNATQAIETIAGVPGMAGCWTAANQPMTWAEDVLTVLPGTLDQATLTRRLRDTDAAVIMKLGRNLPKVRQALADAGVLDRAIYVERGTMPEARVLRLADKTDDAAPYFSMVLVPGQGRRY